MSSRPSERSQRGFSLIELMISIVIGMLALVFATRLMAGSEQNRQASLGGSESMQNGMQALFSINKDAAQAGWGLNDPLVAGCDTIFWDRDGYALASAKRGTDTVMPLAAALIESNGAFPDRLTLYAGSSTSGTGEVGLSLDYTGGATLQVDRVPFGFAAGDVIVVVPESATVPAGRCALAQIAALPAPVDNVNIFSIASGSGATNRYNNAAGLGASYGAGISRIINLGPAAGLALHTWSVENGFLRLRASNMSGASMDSQAVVGNIISLKAQYGFDTRAGFNPELGMQVSAWSPTMIDADGDGTVGNAGDYQRIAALRIAVVARSKEPERPGANGTCSATANSTIVAFGTEAPKGVAAVPMDIPVDTSSTWACYRYRLFESIVPMRNLAWRPTAQ